MELEKCACVTTESVTLSILIAGSAAAQTTTARRGSEVEEVVVYGIRQSTERSIAQKRVNSSQIDVITAEDVTDKVVKSYATGALPLGWNKYRARLSLGLTHIFE